VGAELRGGVTLHGLVLLYNRLPSETTAVEPPTSATTPPLRTAARAQRRNVADHAEQVPLPATRAAATRTRSRRS
jgi:hypothetical protein